MRPIPLHHLSVQTQEAFPVTAAFARYGDKIRENQINRKLIPVRLQNLKMFAIHPSEFEIAHPIERMVLTQSGIPNRALSPDLPCESFTVRESTLFSPTRTV
jgi:hypothetical protein